MPKVILPPAVAVKSASVPAPQPDSLAGEFAPRIAEPKPEVSKIPPAGFENPPPTEPTTAPAVAKETPVSPTSVAAPVKSVPAIKRFVFVKNINPREKIVFTDGSTFRFPTALFPTKDSELAAKIIAVSEKYNIVIQ